jgi:LPS sulfotransferase NodH
MVTAPAHTRRVLIFAQGRSGSTLLESLLASTGHFKVNDEPLMGTGKWVRFPANYLIGLSRDPKRQGPEGHFVCHVKVDHLTKYRARVGSLTIPPTDALRVLFADGWSIIALRRQDRVRQVVSSLYGRKRGNWHKHEDSRERPRLYIDLDQMTERLHAIEERTRVEEEALAGVPHLDIVYERDLLSPARHASTIARVLDFVGLEPKGEVATSLRKIVTQPLSEVIVNYAEGRQRLHRLGYELGEESRSRGPKQETRNTSGSSQ